MRYKLQSITDHEITLEKRETSSSIDTLY